jgi:hypothetical protein
MQGKLLGIISVDFNVTGKLLIIFCVCQIVEKKMGTKRGSASAIYRLQASL